MKESQSNPQLEIQRIYVKDISLESPNAPHVFTETCQPDITMELDIQKNPLSDQLYEITLVVTVRAKTQEKSIFLVEVHQAGIFRLLGFEAAPLEHLLNVYLPSILFPYAREVVSDLVTRASFPQLILAPVNFDALYAQKKQTASHS